MKEPCPNKEFCSKISCVSEILTLYCSQEMGTKTAKSFISQEIDKTANKRELIV